MPVDAAVYTIEINDQQFTFDQSDIAFKDVGTKSLKKSLSTGIATIPARKRQVTFTFRGLDESAVQALKRALADSSTVKDIQLGADIIYDARLTAVKASPIISVRDIRFAEEVVVQFTSQT